MNRISRILFSIALALAPLSAFATVNQVTNLTSAAVATIITPGASAKAITIQNNGAGNVRLSFDGGASYTNPQTGQTGSNPTNSTGYRLVAGAQFTITIRPDSQGVRNPIVAILENSTTTTLDIVTDDGASN